MNKPIGAPQQVAGPAKRAGGLSAFWEADLKKQNFTALEIKKLNETERTLDGAPEDLSSLLLEYDMKGSGTKEATRLHRFVYDLRKLPSSEIGFKLKGQLARLVGELVDRHPAPLASSHEFARALLPKRIERAICEMSDYACLDATMFEVCLNRKADYYYRILNHCWAATYIDDISEAYSSVRTYLTGKDNYRPKDLLFVKRVTEKGRCGICTTFSAAAGGMLMDALMTGRTKFRIECVSPVKGNHCFTIVNREGGANKGIIKAATEEAWGDGWFVVDGWSASLGWDAIYGANEWETIPGFIKEFLCADLVQHFDSSSDASIVGNYAELSKTDVVGQVKKIKAG